MSRQKIGSIWIEMLLGQAVFDKDVANFGKKLTKLGKDAERLGKELSLKVSAPIVAMGALALKSSIAFESAFTGMEKTVKATTDEFALLRKGVLDLSQSIPKSASELAAIGEIGGQLKIQTPNMIEFISTMAMLGDAAPTVEITEAANALGQFAVVTKMGQEDFDRLASSIVMLGNNLATNEGKIIEMAQELAGAGTVVNMTQAEIVGLAGALSQMGLEAQGGGSAISRVLLDMQKQVETGGEKLKVFDALVSGTGKSFAQLFKESSTGALTAFVEGLGQVKEQGGSVVQTLEALDYTEQRVSKALLLASGNAKAFSEAIGLSKKAWADNNALTEEAGKRYKTLESQIKLLWNTFTAFMILIGDDMKPVISGLVVILTDVAKWFQTLDPTVRKASLAFLAVMAVLGPLLIGFGAMVTLIAGPVTVALLGITAIIGLVAAAWVMFASDDFKRGCDIISQNWTKSVADFGKGVDIIMGFFTTDLPASWDGCVANFSKGVDLIISFFSNMGSAVATSVSKLASDIKEYLVDSFDRNVVQPLFQKIEKVKALFVGLYDSVVGNSSVPDLVEGVKTEFAKLDGNMVKPTSNVVGKLKTLFENMGKDGEKGLKKLDKAVDSANDKIADLAQQATPVKQLTQRIKELLQSGDTGDTLADKLKDIRNEFDGTVKGVKDFEKALSTANKEVLKQEGVLDRLDAQVDELAGIDKFPAITAAVKEAFSQRNTQSAEQFAEALKKVKTELVQTKEQAEAFEDALRKGGEAGQDFWSMVLGEGIGKNIDPEALKGLSADVAGALQSAIGNSLRAVLRDGDLKGAFRDFGAEVGGELGGAVFGPLGAVFGEFLGEKVATDISNIGRTAEDTFKGIGTAIDTIFPGIGFGIGEGLKAAFGDSQDAESTARDSILGWIEQQLGGLTSFAGFDFETPAWAEQWWLDMEDNAVLAFSALGEGLAEMLGVTEDVGTQIGFILSQNLGGNLDSARILMNQLGLSAEQLEEIIIKQGIAAGKSWHEIEVMLQGVTALSGEGLVSVGNLSGAFDRLIISGGKGAQAIEDVRNIAIEAMEAGATTLEDLERKLHETGKYTDKEITALMQGLRNRGITSLEDLKNASQRTIGGVIADMITALGENFGKSTEEVQKLIDELNKIPENITTTHTIVEKHKTEGGGGGGGGNPKQGNARGGLFAFANGGIVNSPTMFSFKQGTKRGVMGEAGPEAILPLRRVNGKLGVSAAGTGGMVSNDVYVTVNAPGAQRGAAAEIKAVMEQVIDKAAAKTLRILHDSSRR